MKTALQQLIEELSYVNVKSCNPFIQTTIDIVIEKCKNKLKTEERQISNAHDDALINPDSYGGVSYYKETFKKDDTY